jgi:hypothetical protein
MRPLPEDDLAAFSEGEEVTGIRCIDGSVIKVCACGGMYTLAAWHALEFVAIWSLDEDTLELRQCGCGSTIARRCPDSTPPP